jgi:hypothetical protein
VIIEGRQSRRIDAPSERLWAMVADITRMGERSGPAGWRQVPVMRDVVALVGPSSGVCPEALSGIPDS